MFGGPHLIEFAPIWDRIGESRKRYEVQARDWEGRIRSKPPSPRDGILFEFQRLDVETNAREEGETTNLPTNQRGERERKDEEERILTNQETIRTNLRASRGGGRRWGNE